MNKAKASIIRQASLRLIFSLGLFIIFLGISSYQLYSLALEKSAQERTASLAAFFQTRLQQINKDWELLAHDFKVRLEESHFLENRNQQYSNINLQAFLTIQGGNRRFQYLFIQDKQAHKVFDFGNGLKLNSIPLPASGESGWYLTPGGDLYRIIVVPIWLGERGTGQMALFFEINNALLFNLTIPDVDLSVFHKDNIIASSLGQIGIEKITAAKDKNAKLGRDIAWENRDTDNTLLRIEAPIQALFTTTELVTSAVLIPVIDGLILWFTLGFWLIRKARRINALGSAVHEFTQHAQTTPHLKTHLDAAYDTQEDEISEVVKSFDTMAESIQHFNAVRTQEEAERKLWAQVFAIGNEAILISDHENNIISINSAFTRVTGFTADEVIGKNPRMFRQAQYDKDFYSEMWIALKGTGYWQGEVWNKHKNDEETHPKWLSIATVKDVAGNITHNIATYLDLTHQKAAHAADAARKISEAANIAKSVFLASMSHELRTPLNAVLGYSQLLNTDERLPLDAKEDIQEIEKAGLHLLALISDLIDLSRIEAGMLETTMSPIKVSAVIADSLSMVRPAAEQRNVALIKDLKIDNEITVFANHLRLRQVLINLLSNAIKYNHPNGRVSLGCEIIEGRVRIAVSDTGRGIPLELQYRLFTCFDRLGAEMGTIEGTGVGLVITKRMTEAMEGRIGFESSEGNGSVFWVDFPLCTPVVVAPG